jgi:hypothetical protein
MIAVRSLGGIVMSYKIRRITFEDIDVDPDELMTFAEAARELGVGLYTVKTNVEAGRLTMIVDEDKSWQGRRLVLKKEIKRWKKDHPT